MEIIQTNISDLVVIKPHVFNDARGFFFEAYNEERYKKAGINASFVQDNLSKSSYGVVRGLHFQKPPFAQAKLVQVIQGKVLDVAVDIRKNSPTYGHWHSVVLSDENRLQFFIPRGFAHGFSVLSETAVFSYKCDNLYHPEAEGGIIFNDNSLKIDWQIPNEKMIFSAKDLEHPSFNDLDDIFL